MERFTDFLAQPVYEMANVGSSKTGLGSIIWISVKNANHDPRIKVYKNKRVFVK